MENKPGRFTALDGEKLFFQYWLPEGKPEMVIALVHGLGGHSGRFEQWAEKFCSISIAFASFDLRGHGLSKGKGLKASTLDNFLDDIGLFVDKVAETFPGLPVTLYGHSLGGNLVANYVLKTENHLSALILTSPWFRLSFAFTKVTQVLVGYAGATLPFNNHSKDFIINNLTHDSEVIEKYKSDPLISNRFPLKMLITFFNSGKKAINNAKKIKLPVLIMHGTSDQLTSPKGSTAFYQNSENMASLKLWDGLYHELHSEPERDKVFNYIVEWLRNNVKTQ